MERRMKELVFVLTDLIVIGTVKCLNIVVPTSARRVCW